LKKLPETIRTNIETDDAQIDFRDLRRTTF